MPTKKQLKQMKTDRVRIPGGNEIQTKGGKRSYTTDEQISLNKWNGVISQKSIWDIAQSDHMRFSKGTSWGIKKAK
jgi:hypothetical protein